MSGNRLSLAVIAALGLGVSALSNATAESYPNRLVTLVNPLAAGGTADVLCRLVAERLRSILGQQFILENRPGAGGSIGAEFVARAAPDGHILLCAPEFIFVSHLLNPKLSFDPLAFEAVSVVATYPSVLIGRADLPVSNIVELISYAREHPGKLNYASQGNGSLSHVTMEAIKMRAKIDMVHVPYRGGVPALNDLMAGHVDVLAGPLVASISHIRSGKVKLLGVASGSRLVEFPDARTLPEAIPGLEMETWLGIAAPPGTPKDIAAKLAAAIAEALQIADISARIRELQAEPLGDTPEEMRNLIAKNVEQWGPVITAAKITMD